MPRKSNDVKADFRRRAIYDYLKSQTEAKSIGEIFKALNTQKEWSFNYKTYERDLINMSCDSSYGIISYDNTRPERFTIAPDFVESYEINLSEENLQILALALKNFKNLSSRSFSAYVDQLELNIKSKLPRSIKKTFETAQNFVLPRLPVDGKARAERSRDLEKILLAIRNKYSFTCFYSSFTSPDKSEQLRHFGPVAIEVSGGKVYFLIVDLQEKAHSVKRIKLSRLREVNIVKNCFTQPHPDEIKVWENSYGGFGGKSVNSEKITIIGTDIIRTYFEENELHPSQTIEILSDDEFEVSLHMPITDPLIRTLSGFGGNIYSVRPKKLSNAILKIWQMGIKHLK